MVTRREFDRIKRDNPESRIGKRTWEEQKVRNKLAKTLISAGKKGVKTPLDKHIEEKIKLKNEKEVWEEEKQSREEEKQSLLGKIEEIKQEYFGYLSLKESKQAWEEEKQSREEKKQSLLGKIEEIKKEYSKCFGEFEEMKRKQKGEIDAIKAKKPYEIIEHLEQNLSSLSYPEMLRSLDKIKDSLEKVIQKNRPKNFEELKGNPSKVIEDLKKNYLKVEKNILMYGYKGKVVHVELPSVGGFKGYKFDYFISDDIVDVDTYDKIKGNIKYHTKRSFGKFLNNLNKYMQQFEIELDSGEVYVGGDMLKINENYEYGMDYRYNGGKTSCMNRDYVQHLFNFDSSLMGGFILLGSDALFTVGAGLGNSDELCFDTIRRVSGGHIMAYG